MATGGNHFAPDIVVMDDELAAAGDPYRYVVAHLRVVAGVTNSRVLLFEEGRRLSRSFISPGVMHQLINEYDHRRTTPCLRLATA